MGQTQIGPASLVAGEEERGAFSGAGLLDSVVGTCDSLAGGDWVSAGLGGVSTSLDLAATVSDPLGSLIAAGLGFLIDHLEPIKGWFDDLAGNPEGVAAYAGTWSNVASQLASVTDALVHRLDADLGPMSGAAIAAYRGEARKLKAVTDTMKQECDGVAGSLQAAAALVGFVHGFVRDVLSELVGALISYAAELALSLGLATPLVIEQASTRVASVVGRCSTKIDALVSSSRELERLVELLKDGLRQIKSLLGKIRPNEAPPTGRHRAPGSPDAPRAPHNPADPPGDHRATFPETVRNAGGRHLDDAREDLPYNVRDWIFNNVREQVPEKKDDEEQ